MKMKYISLFSGIGAFEKSLDRLGIEYELVGFSEIDKYAVKSYCAIHGVDESKNLGDITKIDASILPKDVDLVTYGFPCQDISLAGKQQGLFHDDGTQTRSGLFFDALRIIEETKPRVAIAENVKNLTSKRFNAQFQVVLASLEAAGYNNYWQVLNAKDFGVPQNRERVFIVSIRKDIDTGFFQFPEGFPLELRLKDLLEDEVDEKFYLSDKMKQYFEDVTEKNRARNNGNVYKATDIEGVAKTITTKEGSRVKDNFIEEPQLVEAGNLNHYQNDQMNRVYSPDGISPTLLVKSGGGRETKVLVREATKQGYAEAFEGDSINLEQPNSKTRRGRVGHGVAQTLTTSPQQAIVEPINAMPDGTCRTIKNQYFKTSKANFERTSTFGATGVSDGLRIRKLTPKECFRLMDFDDEDFEKAEKLNSNTQLYKQAGNSIVVAVSTYLIQALFNANILIEKEKKEMELKLIEFQSPKDILFNYNELKAELEAKCEMYNTLVYTEDQIGDSKKDRANLNKLDKALNDERIRLEREYLMPFNKFKAQIDDLRSIIKKASANCDKQVKEAEEAAKRKKKDDIQKFWDETEIVLPIPLTLEQIFDEKWLNASVSMKSVQKQIQETLAKIESDLATLSNLPEFSFEAVEVYKTTLNLQKAILEGQRLADIQKRKKAQEEEQARRRAEAERARLEVEARQQEVVGKVSATVNLDGQAVSVAEIPVEAPQKQWIRFQALLSTDDALALKEFFETRNIEFEQI